MSYEIVGDVSEGAKPPSLNIVKLFKYVADGDPAKLNDHLALMEEDEKKEAISTIASNGTNLVIQAIVSKNEETFAQIIKLYKQYDDQSKSNFKKHLLSQLQPYHANVVQLTILANKEKLIEIIIGAIKGMLSKDELIAALKNKTNQGENVLMVAAHVKDPKILESFINSITEIDKNIISDLLQARDNNGNNALMLSAQYGSPEVFKAFAKIYQDYGLDDAILAENKYGIREVYESSRRNTSDEEMVSTVFSTFYQHNQTIPEEKALIINNLINLWLESPLYKTKKSVEAKISQIGDFLHDPKWLEHALGKKQLSEDEKRDINLHTEMIKKILNLKNSSKDTLQTEYNSQAKKIAKLESKIADVEFVIGIKSDIQKSIHDMIEQDKTPQEIIGYIDEALNDFSYLDDVCEYLEAEKQFHLERSKQDQTLLPEPTINNFDKIIDLLNDKMLEAYLFDNVDLHRKIENIITELNESAKFDDVYKLETYRRTIQKYLNTHSDDAEFIELLLGASELLLSISSNKIEMEGQPEEDIESLLRQLHDPSLLVADFTPLEKNQAEKAVDDLFEESPSSHPIELSKEFFDDAIEKVQRLSFNKKMTKEYRDLVVNAINDHKMRFINNRDFTENKLIEHVLAVAKLDKELQEAVEYIFQELGHPLIVSTAGKSESETDKIEGSEVERQAKKQKIIQQNEQLAKQEEIKKLAQYEKFIRDLSSRNQEMNSKVIHNLITNLMQSKDKTQHFETLLSWAIDLSGLLNSNKEQIAERKIVFDCMRSNDLSTDSYLDYINEDKIYEQKLAKAKENIFDYASYLFKQQSAFTEEEEYQLEGVLNFIKNQRRIAGTNEQFMLNLFKLQSDSKEIARFGNIQDKIKEVCEVLSKEYTFDIVSFAEKTKKEKMASDEKAMAQSKKEEKIAIHMPDKSKIEFPILRQIMQVHEETLKEKTIFRQILSQFDVQLDKLKRDYDEKKVPSKMGAQTTYIKDWKIKLKLDQLSEFVNHLKKISSGEYAVNDAVLIAMLSDFVNKNYATDEFIAKTVNDVLNTLNDSYHFDTLTKREIREVETDSLDQMNEEKRAGVQFFDSVLATLREEYAYLDSTAKGEVKDDFLTLQAQIKDKQAAYIEGTLKIDPHKTVAKILSDTSGNPLIERIVEQASLRLKIDLSQVQSLEIEGKSPISHKKMTPEEVAELKVKKEAEQLAKQNAKAQRDERARLAKLPNAWDIVKSNILSGREPNAELNSAIPKLPRIPQKYDFKLLTIEMLEKAINDVNERYKGANPAERGQVPKIIANLEKSFHEAQDAILEHYQQHIEGKLESIHEGHDRIKDKENDAVQNRNQLKAKMKQNQEWIEQKQKELAEYERQYHAAKEGKISAPILTSPKPVDIIIESSNEDPTVNKPDIIASLKAQDQKQRLKAVDKRAVEGHKETTKDVAKEELETSSFLKEILARQGKKPSEVKKQTHQKKDLREDEKKRLDKLTKNAEDIHSELESAEKSFAQAVHLVIAYGSDLKDIEDAIPFKGERVVSVQKSLLDAQEKRVKDLKRAVDLELEIHKENKALKEDETRLKGQIADINRDRIEKEISIQMRINKLQTTPINLKELEEDLPEPLTSEIETEQKKVLSKVNVEIVQGSAVGKISSPSIDSPLSASKEPESIQPAGSPKAVPMPPPAPPVGALRRKGALPANAGLQEKAVTSGPKALKVGKNLPGKGPEKFLDELKERLEDAHGEELRKERERDILAQKRSESEENAKKSEIQKQVQDLIARKRQDEGYQYTDEDLALLKEWSNWTDKAQSAKVDFDKTTDPPLQEIEQALQNAQNQHQNLLDSLNAKLNGAQKQRTEGSSVLNNLLEQEKAKRKANIQLLKRKSDTLYALLDPDVKSEYRYRVKNPSKNMNWIEIQSRKLGKKVYGTKSKRNKQLAFIENTFAALREKENTDVKSLREKALSAYSALAKIQEQIKKEKGRFSSELYQICEERKSQLNQLLDDLKYLEPKMIAPVEMTSEQFLDYLNPKIPTPNPENIQPLENRINELLRAYSDLYTSAGNELGMDYGKGGLLKAKESVIKKEIQSIEYFAKMGDGLAQIEANKLLGKIQQSDQYKEYIKQAMTRKDAYDKNHPVKPKTQTPTPTLIKKDTKAKKQKSGKEKSASSFMPTFFQKKKPAVVNPAEVKPQLLPTSSEASFNVEDIAKMSRNMVILFADTNKSWLAKPGVFRESGEKGNNNQIQQLLLSDSPANIFDAKFDRNDYVSSFKEAMKSISCEGHNDELIALKTEFENANDDAKKTKAAAQFNSFLNKLAVSDNDKDRHVAEILYNYLHLLTLANEQAGTNLMPASNLAVIIAPVIAEQILKLNPLEELRLNPSLRGVFEKVIATNEYKIPFNEKYSPKISPPTSSL